MTVTNEKQRPVQKQKCCPPPRCCFSPRPPSFASEVHTSRRPDIVTQTSPQFWGKLFNTEIINCFTVRALARTLSLSLSANTLPSFWVLLYFSYHVPSVPTATWIKVITGFFCLQSSVLQFILSAENRWAFPKQILGHHNVFNVGVMFKHLREYLKLGFQTAFQIFFSHYFSPRYRWLWHVSTTQTLLQRSLRMNEVGRSTWLRLVKQPVVLGTQMTWPS